MKSIVVAYDLHRGIGAHNDLLWQRDLPADLQHFKALTTGGSIIMGRKTFESIGRALPQRQNIVVSHHMVPVPDVMVADSLQAAYALATKEIFIIGGGSVYEQALADADTIYATEVQADFPAATVFFPALTNEWQEASREHFTRDERNKYDYDFVIYLRV